MSETTETPAGGGGEAAPEPQPTPTPVESTPADTAGDTTEATEGEDKAQQREDRRIAALRARLGAAEREQQRQSAELAYWRQQAAGQPQQQETPEQQAMRVEAEADARAEARLLARRFHDEGRAEFPDWERRCKDLVAMGADPQFANLLVETPGGVRIAAALSEDPEALERIRDIGSERGRAVALGKYAASISSGAAAPARAAPPSPLTRAPAPIRPVTGRAAPTFNEYTASGSQLAEFYAKQALDRR